MQKDIKYFDFVENAMIINMDHADNLLGDPYVQNNEPYIITVPDEQINVTNGK